MNTIRLCLLLACLGCLIGCGQVNVDNSFSDRLSNTIFVDVTGSNLAETATPKIIKELNQDLEKFTPQVRIIAPQAEKVFKQTDIDVQLQVKDLPIFQDEKLKLGNHLDLILDNQPSQSIYDLGKPILLKDLSPGTHTLRVFASRPWGESFKNDGAYAQVTFSVITETNNNRTDSNLPLLTYSTPTGTYGAEPFLLDYYLTNAPLHAVAQSDPNLKNWRIKATVNGESFMLKNWQPVYLTGLKLGENWIQLELIDEAGNDIENSFNNTVRVINYDPQQQNTLDLLVTNQISLAEALFIVEQKDRIKPVKIPEVIQIPVEESIKLEDDSNESANIIKLKPAIKNEEQLSNQSDSISTIAHNPNSEYSKLMPGNSDEVKTTIEPTTNIDNQVITQEKQTDNINYSSGDKDLELKIEKVNTDERKKAEATKSETTEVIEITKINSDRAEPLAKIEIPQPESVEITEQQIAIKIPETKLPDTLESEPKSSTPLWLKKILVGLRQKIEALAKLLPQAV